jgi:hypothetical protein
MGGVDGRRLMRWSKGHRGSRPAGLTKTSVNSVRSNYRRLSVERVNDAIGRRPILSTWFDGHVARTPWRGVRSPR